MTNPAPVPAAPSEGSSAILHAVLAALVAAAISGVQSYMTSTAPQPVVMGVQILAMVLIALNALQSKPSSTLSRIFRKGPPNVTGILCIMGSVVGGGAVATTTVACTPAQQAEVAAIANIVLADLQAGKTRVQIEQDIAQLVAGQTGVDVVAILEDTLQLLIDDGVIPANLLPAAKAMLAEEHDAIAHRTAPAAK